MQLLHRAKFNHRDPRFLGRPIDQNILLHGGHQMGKKGKNSGNETAPSGLWLA
jgi:predicted Holliday junction resolvase-like endonuclease